MASPARHTGSSEELRAYLVRFMEERRIPGLQLAVVRDQHLVATESLGLANLEHGIPVTSDSIFSINSVTKALTGVALMQLVEAGRLDLAAPVSTYLNGLPETWKPISVRQLATLSSGLPDIMVTKADQQVALLGDGTEEKAWETVYSMPLEFSPGSGYAYSQTCYALLGRIIDHLADMPFVQFIAERQLVPAGMSSTRHANDADVIPGRASTYCALNPDGSFADVIYNSRLDWPPVLQTAAGMHSTAEDMAKWIVALQNGTLLTQASVAEMQSPVPLEGGRPGTWGIGWLMGQTAKGRVCAPAGGCKSQIVIYPDGLSVVLLTNLIGGIPEQFQAVSGQEIDVRFIDPIAEHFVG